MDVAPLFLVIQYLILCTYEYIYSFGLKISPFLQHLQFYAEISVAESWMDEKMPILNSSDYGKDEDSVQVRQTYYKRHSM